MYSPKGSIHQFSNPFDGQARALIVQSPDIGAQYFLDVQATVSAGGPPDKAALVAVMARYGLVPARPGGPQIASGHVSRHGRSGNARAYIPPYRGPMAAGLISLSPRAAL